jgi:uroporphyrinogen-III decarboxylase
MTDQHWELLRRIVKGEIVDPLPVGFIIDSPWLPNWSGIRILDYFANDGLWMNANLKVHAEFPDVMFLPGFWSEYGMCTEPSAFGSRCSFPMNEFPYAHRVIHSVDDIGTLPQPNPLTDGLLPFVLNRLRLEQPRIEASGHKIRFAVARGPLNVASFLMGSTELMTAMMMEPEKVEELIKKITTFIKDWLKVQIETFPSIDGIFLLDDIIGFLGETEFCAFALPYYTQLYNFDVSIKFLHNDAPCRVSAPYLPEIGVNLFNMGFDVSMNELKKLTQNKVVLLGNIPPRDVLANGDAEVVRKAIQDLRRSLDDTSRIIFSCGGGMPPGVSTENLRTFIDAVRK